MEPIPRTLLDAIHRRQSVAHLVEPAPSLKQVKLAVQAAMTAPDHKRLRPWRFILIERDDLERLGQLFVQSVQRRGETDPDKLERAQGLTQRSPQIIVAVSRSQPTEKVPDVEQLLSVGAAVQNLLLALAAQGFGSYWRTGALAYDRTLARALGLDENEQIAGFIYAGTIGKLPPARATPEPEDHLSLWPS